MRGSAVQARPVRLRLLSMLSLGALLSLLLVHGHPSAHSSLGPDRVTARADVVAVTISQSRSVGQLGVPQHREPSLTARAERSWADPGISPGSTAHSEGRCVRASAAVSAAAPRGPPALG